MNQLRSCFYPGRILGLRRRGCCFIPLHAAVLPHRYRRLLPSQFDDGFKDPCPEDLSVQSRPAPIRASSSVLKADQVLELSVTGWSSVLELLQSDIGDDQTGVSIAFVIAFVMLVKRPRLPGALGKDKPVFNMVSCRHPVQLDRLLVACHKHRSLSPAPD